MGDLIWSREKFSIMSDSVEKGLLPAILLKRDNYEEWKQSIMRKLNEAPMMVEWIQGNREAEMDFSIIPFQTRFMRVQPVAEPGTGRMVDQEVEEWHTHQESQLDVLIQHIMTG